ncbi:hypothetical protein D3C72_762310 [compost metagenome]
MLDAKLVGDRLQLHTVIEGEDAHRLPVALAVGGPVHLLQRLVLAQRPVADAGLEEILQLFPARIGRGAAMTGDGEGAAGIGVFQRRRPVFAAQPAAEQPGHETVTRTQNVEDLDRETFARLAIIEAIGNSAGEDDGAHRSALAHQRRIRDLAHGVERGERIGGAARDVELLFRADDQVEQMQGGLQLGGNLLRFHKTAFAIAMAGHTPEIGAVIDIERGLCAIFAGEFQCFQHRRFRFRMRQMRAGGADAACLGDESGIDIVFAERHVGTVFTIEDQRELVLVANAEQHQRGQPLRVRLHAAHVDAFTHQLFADEAAHMLVADTGDDGAVEPQARSAGGNIGGRAADIFGKGGHVLQTAADLRAVQIDRRAPDRDKIKFFQKLPP